MARWYGYTLEQTRQMSLTDFWMLDGFLVRHPPIDLLVAAYLGVKPEEKQKGGKVPIRQAAKYNAGVMAQLPPNRNVKTLAQMPSYVNSPEKQEMLRKMRAEYGQ